MKYAVIAVAVIAACLLLGYAMSRLLMRRRWAGLKKSRKALASGAMSILIAGILSFAYLGVYYHADSSARDALKSSRTVIVTHESNVYSFDGPGEETALVFYPGAKVEAVAYAPLMSQLAEQGIDCYLLEVPYRIAFFRSNAAESVIVANEYERWLVGGHSLGGVVASRFAANHPEQVSGVVLLASYPTASLPDTVSLCSLYGSNDGCLNHDAYEGGRGNWPKDAVEVVIDGGNHAYFGNYGEQDGDGASTITREEQQKLTVRAIVQFAEGSKGLPHSI